nr:MAG: DNA pilot protein [Microvirus sp.]
MSWWNPVSAVSAAVDSVVDVANYMEQRKTNRWNKNAQRITWEREDNAVQRRVADLKAAGLSPTLAAGSAASVSSPTRVETPEMRPGPGQRFLETTGAYLALAKQKEDIARTRAENRYIQVQTDRAQAEAEGAKIDNAFKQQFNPGRVEQVRLQNMLARDLNPQKVREIVTRVENMSYEGAKKKADAAIAQTRVTREQVQLVKDKIYNQLLERNVEKAKIDVIAKELAVKINEIQRRQKAHDLDIWQFLRLPSGTGLDPIARGATSITGILAEQFGKLFRENNTGGAGRKF